MANQLSWLWIAAAIVLAILGYIAYRFRLRRATSRRKGFDRYAETDTPWDKPGQRSQDPAPGVSSPHDLERWQKSSTH